MKKKDFLLHKNHKINFIELLVNILHENCVETIQSKGDTDLDIVLAGLKTTLKAPTVVVGEDTDYLILLIHYSNA